MSTRGRILYKDGTSEPIITYIEREYDCEVITDSGTYLYHPCVLTAPNGMQLGDYQFYKYDYYRRTWYEVDNIKEFRFDERIEL